MMLNFCAEAVNVLWCIIFYQLLVLYHILYFIQAWFRGLEMQQSTLVSDGVSTGFGALLWLVTGIDKITV